MATRLADVQYERAAAAEGYALAVIVPTYNEADNVARIVAALDGALAGLAFEIIFVDDWSADGTADRIAEIARARTDIRALRRYGRRGLATAVIEGMMATMAPVVAVIDGDGQHDERLLPRLHMAVATGVADVAIGSRYCADGSTGEWGAGRLRASRLATWASRLVLRTPVADPMSGFFVVRRDAVIARLPALSGRGFKILFDLLTAGPEPLRAVELPFRFRTREHGASKAGAGVGLDHAVMVAERLLRRWLPSRFALFALVGAFGLFVHLGVLKLLLDAAGASFAAAQTGAVVTAIACNFLLNNAVTYRDRRLRGWRWWAGLASFYAICGAGALANVGAGAALFAAHERWWVSGIAGAVIGSAWNFMASALVTWRRR